MNFVDYIDTDDLLQFAQVLVRIPSHKEAQGRERHVAQFIHNFAIDRGLHSEMKEVIDGRSNVLITLPGTGNGKKLLLNGHTDTVPPYMMTIDPFGAIIRDGQLWGRGAAGMKGALASMLFTLLAIRNSGVKLKGDLVFSAVIGEEEKSEGTEELVLQGFKADGAIVGEPTDYGYVLAHRGLEWMEFTFKGLSAHGGRPHRGINAISHASAFVHRVEKELMPRLSERVHDQMGPSVMNWGRIEGGSQPSMVADHCSVQVDRRYIPGETLESVMDEYQEILDALKEEIQGFDAKMEVMEDNRMRYFEHAYLATSPEEEIVKVSRSVLADFLGREPQVEKDRGWTDAATLSTFGKIPTIVTGPGSLTNANTQDEHIPVQDIINYVNIYAKIALAFCESQE